MKQKGFAPIILIVILAIVGIGGYFFYKQATPVPGSPDILPSLKTTIETNNWETYTSTAYGYSIRYPQGWKIEKENEAISIVKQDNTDEYSNYISIRTTFSNNYVADAPKTETTINGYPVTKWGNHIYFLTTPNKEKLVITIYSPQNAALFDAILSTFEFTN